MVHRFLTMLYKIIFLFAFVAISGHGAAQDSQVSLQFDKTMVHEGDSLHFSIWCNANEALEVFVLGGDSLMFQQNVQIAFSEIPFHIATAGFPVGRYFILVTGSGIHIEKEFLLWHEE